MTAEPNPFDALLRAHRAGDPGALEALVELLYGDLKRLARRELGRRRPFETLNTTALVHEAYLKFAGNRSADWEGRQHFLGAAARAMRHILVDAARRRLSQKQGGGQRPETLEEGLIGDVSAAEQVLAVDQALEGLRAMDERTSRVVECQFFAGYTQEETAAVLGVSVRTVHRDWLRARGWLRRRLGTGARGTKP